MLSVEQGRALGIFPTTKYLERDSRPETLLRAAIANVLAPRSAAVQAVPEEIQMVAIMATVAATAAATTASTA